MFSLLENVRWPYIKTDRQLFRILQDNTEEIEFGGMIFKCRIHPSDILNNLLKNGVISLCLHDKLKRWSEMAESYEMPIPYRDVRFKDCIKCCNRFKCGWFDWESMVGTNVANTLPYNR